MSEGRIPQWRLKIAHRLVVAQVACQLLGEFDKLEALGLTSIEKIAARLEWTVEQTRDTLASPKKWRIRTLAELAFAMDCEMRVELKQRGTP